MHKFSNNLISFNSRIGGTTDNPGVKWNLVINCPVDPQTSLRRHMHQWTGTKTLL